MDDYAGRVLADRYRLPLPPSDEYELAETRAFDTYSGQEVLIRQVPLPEVVEAEVLEADGVAAPRRAPGRTARGPADPAVRRAIEAAQSAAQIPDHPRLDQVFDVFAESGSLWIVSELVGARPLAALLAEEPLNPYRAAEIASDVLTAVRVLHAHGWTHRNITARTVLVCEDGRVVLTGLAAGAAEEALCGYAPVPEHVGVEAPEQAPGLPGAQDGPDVPGAREMPGVPGAPVRERLGEQVREGIEEQPAPPGLPYGADPYALGGHQPGTTAGMPGPQGRAALGPYREDSSGTSGAMPRPPQQGGMPALPGAGASGSASGDIRAARAGAIAAYRAGARAAARVTGDEQRTDTGTVAGTETGAQTGAEALPAARPGAGEPPQAPGESPAGPPRGTDPDWWAQPPHAFDESDPDDDDDPPAPYRAQLAGTWRDGPAPWNDASGQLPAGGGPSPYTSGIPVGGGRPGPPPGDGGPDGSGGTDVPALPEGFPAAGDRPGSRPGGRRDDRSGDRPATPPGPGAAVARTGDGDSPYSAPGGGNDALRADAQRHRQEQQPFLEPPLPVPAGHGAGHGRWDEPVPVGAGLAYRGPTTVLAAERARQARIAVVGAVTERWAPEQAGPVHENWQLAPPIGPATDLWALGALLYRAVQGHAPYPEESAAELVQLVCAEPPAFAEECGALRPVVESLLRQDPTERPDFEELRGWLRSLIRSAPEPEAGQDVVELPSIDGRLPIVRRRGELVRRRRRGESGRHRHKRGRAKERKEQRGAKGAVAQERYADTGVRDGFQEPDERSQTYGHPAAERAGHGEQVDGAGQFEQFQQFRRYEEPERPGEQERNAEHGRYDGGGRYEEAGQPGARGSRHLGRTLLIAVLIVLATGVGYAVVVMPKSGTQEGGSVGEASSPGSSAQAQSPGPQSPAPGSSAPEKPDSPSKPASQETVPAANLPKGYVLRKDTEGFQVAVPQAWQRRPVNDSQQVRYADGGFQLIVVTGRDSVQDMGGDPMKYQLDKEPELTQYRTSSWATSGNLLRIDVGRKATAEGLFTWQDSNGIEVAVRNDAMIIDGRYHIVQVIGPKTESDKVKEVFEQAKASYQVTR
ncbi:protein kinase [Streptomyces sp. NPDC088725]|uniref:protein kinase n=1 Tax=Streptomyces sp. NPDC088725 TaxID=3365873 RepID=UPI003812CB95